MKKFILYLLILSLLSIFLIACIPMNMNNVVKEANFTGIVEETYENSILLRVDDDQGLSTDLVSVSLDVKLKDSMTEFEIGQVVRVYYNGAVAESYPAQVNTVYAILIVDEE